MDSGDMEMDFSSLLVDEDFDEEMEESQQDKTTRIFPCLVCGINLRNSEEFYWHHKSHVRLPTISLQRLDQHLKKTIVSQKKKSLHCGTNNVRKQFEKKIKKCNPNRINKAKIKFNIVHKNHYRETKHVHKKDNKRNEPKVEKEKKLVEPEQQKSLDLPKIVVQKAFLAQPYVIRNIFDQSICIKNGQTLTKPAVTDFNGKSLGSSNEVPPLVPINYPRTIVVLSPICVVSIKNPLSSPYRNQFESPLMRAPLPTIPKSTNINGPSPCSRVFPSPTFKCLNEKCPKIFYRRSMRDLHKKSCGNISMNTK